MERSPKTSFPADKVFAATDRSRLVLVTCGGAWVGGDVGYADNVIVFATLIVTRHAARSSQWAQRGSGAR